MLNMQSKLENLPTTPGVYIYKNAKGNVLYVGKAKVLRSRVQSYFRAKTALDAAKREMVKKIADLETISTDTETEALILEANLIRQHQPPYNVVLRDDKYYLFIKITTKEELPRVFPVRRIKNDGARYFGPYSSARSVRQTLQLLRRIFPFREEKESPREIIFPHPLFSSPYQGEVPRPLAGQRGGNAGITPSPRAKRSGLPLGKGEKVIEQYTDNIANIIRFLRGQRQEIMTTLASGMRDASHTHQYERAAMFRDQLQAIEHLEGSQKVFLTHQESFDVVSIAQEPSRSAANVFQIRDGKLLGKQTFLLTHRASASLEDTLRQFLLQYYRVAQDIPPLILIPTSLPDQDAIATFITSTPSLQFAIPERGKKKQLLLMGTTNAKLLLNEQAAVSQTAASRESALAALFKAIGLPPGTAPVRIETYDVSNIQGTLATASMIVFIDGAPAPKFYRKFRLELSGTPNDFAMIQEALRRRFAHHQHAWPLPNLVIIDGGKGQLSAAQTVLHELDVHVPVIAIAKREEEIFIPEKSGSTRLAYDSPALYLIQRMRDEAHRFTITYHRLLRSKQQRRSLLDEVPSIGPKTKRQLLTAFGSLQAIRAAGEDELARIIGAAKAKILQDYL